jgi:riboflavin synthase
VAEVVAMAEEGDSTRVTLRAPRTLARFIAPKGSVALNGTSLTVNEVDGCDFGVCWSHCLAARCEGKKR